MMGLSLNLNVSVASGILLGGGEAGVPAWVPMGAIGFADFTSGASGNYWDGTAAVTADEMFVSDSTNYSVTFDSSTLTASGLPGGDATEASGFNTPGGTVRGLLGAAMLNGCILVATFSRVQASNANPDGAGIQFEAYDAPDYNTDWFMNSDDASTRTRDYTGGDGYHSTGAANATGSSKVAWEFDPGVSMSVSSNGAAAVSTTATVSDGNPINQVSFKVAEATSTAANGGTIFLETLSVYPVGYADIQTLSAL